SSWMSSTLLVPSHNSAISEATGLSLCSLLEMGLKARYPSSPADNKTAGFTMGLEGTPFYPRKRSISSLTRFMCANNKPLEFVGAEALVTWDGLVGPSHVARGNAGSISKFGSAHLFGKAKAMISSL